MKETEEALPDSSNLRMQRSDDAVLKHVAAGCNRVAGGLDWGRYIAYAAHSTIVLYDLDVRSKEKNALPESSLSPGATFFFLSISTSSLNNAIRYDMRRHHR